MRIIEIQFYREVLTEELQGLLSEELDQKFVNQAKKILKDDAAQNLHDFSLNFLQEVLRNTNSISDAEAQNVKAGTINKNSDTHNFTLT